MTEQKTPVMENPAAPSAPEAPAAPATPTLSPKQNQEKRKKRKKLIRNLIITVVVLAALAGGGFLTWKLVFEEKEEENPNEPIYDQATIGSIVSTVRGGGTANAKDSASITFSQDGTVDQIFVTQGQMVNKGDPLYVVSSTAANEALATAKESLLKQQEAMTVLQKDLTDLQKSRNDLTITAPHAGKLTEVADLKVGDPMASGSKIAVVVDDTRLKLSLYYSYAYENDISVGQATTISIPSVMGTFEATVEKINKVERITPEGGKTFEVVFVMKNPGTLTADMAASATLADGSGVPIYPYQDGKLAYYQTTTVATKAQGPVESMGDLLNYANVSAGQVLVVQGTNDIDEQIRAKQEQITEAQKTYDEAAKKVENEQKNLNNFSAVAPITGTVVAFALTEGQEVKSGGTAITIADNSVMSVNINIDDRNRQYIEVGMNINLNDWNGNSYMGTVDTVAVVGTVENGITVYPAKVIIDNSTGTLMGGYGLDYEFTASQSMDCVVIPIQDVRYYTPDGAEKPQPVVYIQTDTAPENAIERTLLPAEMQKELPKDCFAVPVEVGLSDDMNVEIKSGVKEGDMLYNNTPKDDGSYYGRKSSSSAKAG